MLLILIIGMKGCEPGAKLCPERRTLKQRGGSISSCDQSAYLADLTEPSKVLPAVLLFLARVPYLFVLWPRLLPAAAVEATSYFIFEWLPFCKLMKHCAIWKKYESGS